MFWTFLKAIGISDVLDIVLVSALIYALLVWFKRAKAAFVAKGMVVVTVIYMLASVSGMVMTTSIFHALFAILLVALVVIFQEELRTTFERIAVWSLSGGKDPLVEGGFSGDLLETLGDLSRERVGALVVLRGQDPLDRHLEGGWKLGGEFSEALLRSIFDDHSIGHDGAVILEGRKVTHFGCRLPLSKEFSKTAKLGTRHTAALGLSELSDAMCIVVSEERGTISIAQDGKLETVRKIADLEKMLMEFTQGKQPQSAGDNMSGFLRRNSREKAVALSASILLWGLFVLGLKTTDRTFDVPVDFRNVPAGLRVAEPEKTRILLTYTGEMRNFYRVRSRHLSVSLDLDGGVVGLNHIRLREQEVPHPYGLVLQEFSPSLIDVRLMSSQSAQDAKL